MFNTCTQLNVNEIREFSHPGGLHLATARRNFSQSELIVLLREFGLVLDFRHRRCSVKSGL